MVDSTLFTTLFDLEVESLFPPDTIPYLDNAAQLLDTWWQELHKRAGGGEPSPADAAALRMWGAALILRAQLDARELWFVPRPGDAELFANPSNHYTAMLALRAMCTARPAYA